MFFIDVLHCIEAYLQYQHLKTRPTIPIAISGNEILSIDVRCPPRGTLCQLSCRVLCSACFFIVEYENTSVCIAVRGFGFEQRVVEPKAESQQ
jgi:hypothetical protein